MTSDLLKVKTLCILIDTFCATNCSYCNLPSRGKNPARYGYNKLDNLVKWSTPDRISIFGGDTFYDHSNIREVYDYFISTPCNHTHVTSEIQKLPRDFDIRVETTLKCQNAGKVASSEFSADLDGKKSGNFVKELNEYAKASKLGSITLNCVLTVKHLIDPDILSKIEEYLDTYSGLEFYGNVVFNLEHSSAQTYLLRDLDVYTLIKSIQEKLKPNIKFGSQGIIGTIPRMNQYNGCYIRGKAAVVLPDGSLSACFKFDPKLDIQEKISALNISLEEYTRYQEIRHAFNKPLLPKSCIDCEAKPICSLCPKKSVLNPNFDKMGSDLCLFYKSLFKIAGTTNPRDIIMQQILQGVF